MRALELDALIAAAGYVDWSFSIDAIRLAAAPAEVLFAVCDTEGSGASVRIRLLVSSLVDFQVDRHDASAYAHIETTHPLLWPYNEPAGELYIKGRPDALKAAAFDLFAAHHAAYGGAASFSPTILNGLYAGHGRLATGPQVLLQRYADVLQAYGVKTSMLAVARHEQPKACILFLGSSYFIGETFRFERLVENQ